MHTEITYLSMNINNERKYENSPFRWQFDGFQISVLDSYGDNLFAVSLPHGETTMTNGSRMFATGWRQLLWEGGDGWRRGLIC